MEVQLDVIGGVWLVARVEGGDRAGWPPPVLRVSQGVRRATARPVCEALAEAMRRPGVPDQIRTDKGVHRPVRTVGRGILFDRICRDKWNPSLVDGASVARHHREGETVPQEPQRKGSSPARPLSQSNDAHAAVEGCMAKCTLRPYQRSGMVSPIIRLELGWLAENRPERSLSSRTDLEGTLIAPELLVVSDYGFFNDVRGRGS